MQLTKKFQNTRTSLSESVQAITKAGLHRWLASSLALMVSGSGDALSNLLKQPFQYHVWHAASATHRAWHRLERRVQVEMANINDFDEFYPTRP